MTHIWDHELAKHMIERLIKGMTFEPCCKPYYQNAPLADGHCCFDEMRAQGITDESWTEIELSKASVPHPCHFWEPRVAIQGNDYDGDFTILNDSGSYWIYWYTRMTSDWSFAETAARYFAERDDKAMAELWRETARDIRRMGIDFGTALYALGGYL